MATLNWQDLINAAGEVADFEALPVGDYELKIVEAEAKTSSNGKPMFKVKMQVQSGPYANRIVWHQFVISAESDKALGIFFSQMKVLGLSKEWFNSGPSQEQIAATLVGRPFVGKLGHREYNGQTQNELKGMKPLVASAPVPSAPAAPAASAPMPPAAPPAPPAAPPAPPAPQAPAAPF